MTRHVRTESLAEAEAAPVELEDLARRRAEARERKDFAEADRIRDALAEAGVVVEDTATVPRWRVG